MDRSNEKNKKTKETEGEYLPYVRKPNFLISSVSSPNLLGQKLFLIALQRARIVNTGELKEGELMVLEEIKKETRLDYSSGMVALISLTECKKLLGVTGGRHTDLLVNYINSLMCGDWVLFQHSKEYYSGINLIECATADRIRKKIYIKFTSEEGILEQLFFIKNNYTVEYLDTFLKFKSIFSFRIFEICLEKYKKHLYYNKNSRKLTFQIGISELKFKLGLYQNVKITKSGREKIRQLLSEPQPDYLKAEHIYPNADRVYNSFNYFSRAVLSVARAEINELTYFNFSFSPVYEHGRKTARKIQVVFEKRDKYSGKVKASPKTDENAMFLEDVKKLILEEHRAYFSEKDYLALLEVSGCDIEKVKNAYQVLCKTPKIKSFMGFLIRAIEEGYKINPVSLPENRYSPKSRRNYIEREYTKEQYEEMERKLLERSAGKLTKNA